MKIRLIGAELLQADGRTDMEKLTVAFRSFKKAPKNSFSSLVTFICNMEKKSKTCGRTV